MLFVDRHWVFLLLYVVNACCFPLVVVICLRFDALLYFVVPCACLLLYVVSCLLLVRHCSFCVCFSFVLFGCLLFNIECYC